MYHVCTYKIKNKQKVEKTFIDVGKLNKISAPVVKHIRCINTHIQHTQTHMQTCRLFFLLVPRVFI